jgi:chromate transporter
LPEFASLQAVPAVLTVIALLLLFRLRWGLGRVLLVCTALGIASTWLPT